MALQSGGLPWSTKETGSVSFWKVRSISVVVMSFPIHVVGCPHWKQGVTGCWSRKDLYAGHDQTAWWHWDVPILGRWSCFSNRERWLFLRFACCGNGRSWGAGFLSAAIAVSAHSSAFGSTGCWDVRLLCSFLPRFASYLWVCSSSSMTLRQSVSFFWNNHPDTLMIQICSVIKLYVNEQRNILQEIRKQKANWIGHILRRNCLLRQVIEGKIKGEMEVARRRGRRHKKLLDDLKDRRGYSHLKEEALDRTMWRNRFGGGFGPVVRQNTEWMNEWKLHVLGICSAHHQEFSTVHTTLLSFMLDLVTVSKQSQELSSIVTLLGNGHQNPAWNSAVLNVQ